MEIAFKWRERRWQHREETMATNRELSGMGDDIEVDSGQEEYYKDRSRWWFHRQQKAMEAELNNEKDILTLATIGASQNNSVKPELTLNLASKQDELFSFVIDHLCSNKKPAEDLIKEMIMKLWRMLIFETESKTRKI
ncbi:hypothetical protein GLOIN_2v1736813 [Rhizophagus irregularis DAOM 181602=DAOM 197198]|uniref:Uncharacterized protein n=1 Tax=Rhizophagus irregularis (strain DAOM 181602 / DAOM 197198 / MUCL 43194) TaxID=747089 RepID=A0A2P4NXB2_RHIID|nr:hypothetical protein GLOIN_2v1736813 [Rhizophagus irregularis DAOM 181602=DAOM 197198]POG57781.1 hypothetical protein GLOIN_2v1736813 [Rhizophagus irregularis DAOM 181602=DAOM 197198]|eukprot:XP_025164647.1 hypothetical protein GLOIN_2v1736813 [Rhizophagus irregularis DAOM 181602=DAOM 197198]